MKTFSWDLTNDTKFVIFCWSWSTQEFSSPRCISEVPKHFLINQILVQPLLGQFTDDVMVLWESTPRHLLSVPSKITSLQTEGFLQESKAFAWFCCRESSFRILEWRCSWFEQLKSVGNFNKFQSCFFAFLVKQMFFGDSRQRGRILNVNCTLKHVFF